MPPIPFDNSYARLPEHFFAFVEPAQVPEPKSIRVNTSLAATLGLDMDWLGSADGLAMLAGNAMPEGAEPLAQAYAGHQFGGWVPQLGDGRAILLGEIIDGEGNRRDIQLKGSGRTPYSRGGDGKAAIGPVLREYILSEAMHALGVPTTRALAVVTTGETVYRETPLPGAILTRVAKSHIRVGTFQFFYAQNDVQALRALADHAIARHYPEALQAENPYKAFLESVIAAQARLIAQWMHLGFIHGVMNTDNMTISGETIDYGPCAFMDTFQADKVFSSIDRNGRYAWSNQPMAGHWNLMRLAEAVSPLLSINTEDATAQAESAIETFTEHFSGHYLAGFCSKFGLPDETTDADVFVKGTLSTLAEQKVDFTLFFRHLTKVAEGNSADELGALFENPDAFSAWLSHWREMAQGVTEDRLSRMRSANPILIPRNHRVEEAIQDAQQNSDFTAFHRLVEATARPFDDRPEYADLEKAPNPSEIVARHSVVPNRTRRRSYYQYYA